MGVDEGCDVGEIDRGEGTEASTHSGYQLPQPTASRYTLVAAGVWTRRICSSQVTGRTDGGRDRVEHQRVGTLGERHRAGALRCCATTGRQRFRYAGATLFVGDILQGSVIVGPESRPHVDGVTAGVCGEHT